METAEKYKKDLNKISKILKGIIETITLSPYHNHHQKLKKNNRKLWNRTLPSHYELILKSSFEFKTNDYLKGPARNSGTIDIHIFFE